MLATENFVIPEITSQNIHSYDKSTKLICMRYKFTLLLEGKTKYCESVWQCPVATRTENTRPCIHGSMLDVASQTRGLVK